MLGTVLGVFVGDSEGISLGGLVSPVLLGLTVGL